MEHDFRKHLIVCAEAYAKAEGISIGRASAMAGGNYAFIKRIENGGSFNLRTYERAMRFFSRAWPSGVDWPAGIPRPTTEAA